MSKNTSGKNGGCLMFCFYIIAFCLAVTIYSYAWIPAVIAAIFFTVKKDRANRKRNLIISVAVSVTSLLLFIGLNSTPDLTGISVEWDSAEYDIADTTEVRITPIPHDAEIESLIISKNPIATLEFEDGDALISFKKLGDASISFTANGEIESDTTRIKVIDKAAEAKRLEEERIAAEKAEQERLEAEKAEQERIAAEQAEQERIAAEQAAQQQAEPQEEMVWIPSSGSKYHSRSSCSGMKNPSEVTLSEAKSRGYTPCKRCH